MSWPVFMIERAPLQNRYLRRFTYSERTPCPKAPPDLQIGHDAWAFLDVEEDPAFDVQDGEALKQMFQEADERGDTHLLRQIAVGDLWPHDDDRWPELCALCGEYRFEDDDEWQLHQKDLWRAMSPRRQEELEPFELPDSPVGSMWNAWWDAFSGEDGRSLHVRLPGGRDWALDRTTPNGAPWERTGKPPRITVSPSIATPEYHGFLVAGELTDDLEGRTYDDG